MSSLPVVSTRALRQARERSGLTQEQVAPLVSVTRASVQNYERGNRVPRADVLAALARLYGVSLESLFVHEEERASGDTARTENGQVAA